MATVYVLGPEAICCESGDFFALGGDSLSALRLLMRLRTAAVADVGVQQFFAAPTVPMITSASAVCCTPTAPSSASGETGEAEGSAPLRSR